MVYFQPMKNTESLKNYIQFKTVYDQKKARSDNYLIMFIRKNDLNINRLGISVSKKVGNSIVRHRLARLIREAYRLHEDMFNSGLDMVIVAKAAANPSKDSSVRALKCSDVEKSLLKLAGFHHILK